MSTNFGKRCKMFQCVYARPYRDASNNIISDYVICYFDGCPKFDYDICEHLISPIQQKLLEILTIKGPMTRSQIVDIINRPRTTIYDNLTVLINKEKVKKFSRQVNSTGRPVIFFKIKE